MVLEEEIIKAGELAKNIGDLLTQVPQSGDERHLVLLSQKLDRVVITLDMVILANDMELETVGIKDVQRLIADLPQNRKNNVGYNERDRINDSETRKYELKPHPEC